MDVEHIICDNICEGTFITRSLKVVLNSTTFHRRIDTNIRTLSASGSIMWWVVEDVTEKKIEHLIKRSLSTDRALPFVGMCN